MTADASDSDRTLTIELARAVVTEVAPDELAAFDASAARYLGASRGTARGSDEMLGFGLEALLPVVTSGAVGIAAYSVQRVFEESTKTLAVKGSGALMDWLTGLFRKRSRTKPARLAGKTLTPEQLARVREGARRAALRCGVTAARADLLADSVVGQLAISS